jgi:5-methylcytosine-specific restriction endonuclease McrA
MVNRTLLLNATYEPMRVISWQRAVTMLCMGKVEVVKSYDRLLRAVSWTLEMPSVVRLNTYVKRHRIRIAMTRQNLFLRDNHQCQYCLKKLPAKELTRDHVVPRSRGGAMTWDNIVAACAPCNRKKGGRTPDEARMTLARPPERPKGLPAQYGLNIGRDPHEHWTDFLSWAS